MAFGNTIGNPAFDRDATEVGASTSDIRGNLDYFFSDGEAETLRLDNRAAGEKTLFDFDPDDGDRLVFRVDGGYFDGRNQYTVDSMESFRSLVEMVDIAAGAKGGGRSYVTVDGDALILHIDADSHFRGDLRLVLPGYADVAREIGVVKVIDFDEFDLSDPATPNSDFDPNEESLRSLTGESGAGAAVYEGFVWSQVGIYDPPGEANIGYRPSSGANTAFVGEKDGGDRGYAGYLGDPGAGVTIERDERFSFIGAAFNAVGSEFATLDITVRAFDGTDLVGEMTFTADATGAQDFVTFSDNDDDQRFEAITKLEIDGPFYFGFDDFTYA